jgi:hypothetical protein
MSAVITAEPDAPPKIDRIDVASRTLRAIAKAYGFDGDNQHLADVFETLTECWRAAPAAGLPPWSGLGADASGCDVSIVLGAPHREIRVTVEAQDYPASPEAYWRAAMQLCETLGARYGADLSRIHAVKDVFRSFSADAAGVLWHGAVFRKGRAPWFKVYLHLMSQGRPNARQTTVAALDRLGLSGVWPEIERRLQPKDELLFLSFDLVSARQGRVKLYIRHGEASPAGLASVGRMDGADHSVDVQEFVGTLIDGSTIRRGALTSYHLSEGAAAPLHATTHIRLYPHCGGSDADLALKLNRILRRFDIETKPYEDVLATLADGTLRGEQGIHGWASIQWIYNRPIVTVYFSPRIYLGQFGTIGLDPVRMWPSPLT